MYIVNYIDLYWSRWQQFTDTQDRGTREKTKKKNQVKKTVADTTDEINLPRSGFAPHTTVHRRYSNVIDF